MSQVFDKNSESTLRDDITQQALIEEQKLERKIFRNLLKNIHPSLLQKSPVCKH